MKNVALIVACFAMCAMMSCGGDGVVNGGKPVKLSPPAWIQGSWGYDGYEIFRFTKDDVFFGNYSLKTIWNVSVPGASVSLKESKNTNSLYEITITGKAGGESASAIYSFKKGDGSYIEAASNENGTNVSDYDYERLDKVN